MLQAFHDNFIAPMLIISPVVLAGLAFIFILKHGYFSWLKKPMDQGWQLGGKRILGDNKTWLGPITMCLGSLVFGTLWVTSGLSCTSATPYLCRGWQIVLTFGILGLAYSLGELPNSFLKRKLGIAPGEKANNTMHRAIFRILDIGDSVIAVALAAKILLPISVETTIYIIVAGYIVHITTDLLMVSLGLKK